MVVAILLAVYVPQQAFLLMYGSAVAGMYFVWMVILLAHIRFRRSLGQEVNRLPLKLKFSPYSNIAGIAILLATTCSTFYVHGLEYSVPAFAVLLAAISLVYWRVHRGAHAHGSAELQVGADVAPPPAAVLRPMTPEESDR
jgi:AAT family amino acid transporter